MIKYNILFASLVFGGVLFSQNNVKSLNVGNDSVVMLYDIGVNENRIMNTGPFRSNKSIDVLTARQISFLPVRSVQEALQFVAGVDIRQRGPGGTQADISIDGGTFDQSLILLNGFKMSDIQTGHHNLNLPFPMIAVGQVEVYKGAQSRLFGPGALTGAVNFKISAKGNEGTKLHAYSGSNFKNDLVNQYKYLNSGVQASHGFKTGRLNHLMSANFESGTGYRYNTGFNRQQLFYMLDFDVNEQNSFELMVGGNFNQFGANAFYVQPIRPDTFSAEANAQETVATFFVAFQSFHKLGKWNLNPRASLRLNYDEYIYIRQRPSFFKNKHQTDVSAFELHANRQLGKGTIGLGAESRFENINSSNLGKRYRNNQGIYAEYKYALSPKSDITPGFYMNYNSDFGANIFPSLDVDYRLTNRFKLYSHTGTAMRNPTYTDWFYKGPANDGNPNLVPEQSFQSEFGIKTFNKSLFFTAYIFYRQVENLVTWVRPNIVARYKPENIVKTETQGLNLSVKTNELLQTSKFNLIASGSYTFLNTSFDKNFVGESKYELNNLRHQAVAGLVLKYTDIVFLSVNHRYVVHEIGSKYHLIDARINFKLKNMGLYFDVNNIGNISYVQVNAIPLPGRWFTMGLKMGMN